MHYHFNLGNFSPGLIGELLLGNVKRLIVNEKYTMQERLARGSRVLSSLSVGDHVLIQEQHGNRPRQWVKSGIVVEVGPYDNYLVSIGGSRQLTKRNRQFLKKK